MSQYSLPGPFLDEPISISSSRRASDFSLESSSERRVDVNVVREPFPRYPGEIGYLNKAFVRPNARGPNSAVSSQLITHKVPEYGYSYEDWNWLWIRRTCTALTVAVIVGLVAASIGLVVVSSQICYPKFHWWQGVTIYRANPKTFNDRDEDGRGDFAGMTDRLEYVKEFGASVIMLANVFDCLEESAGGECLALDHHRIRPFYGDYDTLFELTTEAHRLGLHVVATIPAGYTSTQHAWFQASRQQAKTSSNKFTNYYVWSDEPDPVLPSAFDQVRSQYYLYHGMESHPLLNWNTSAVREDVESSMVRLLRAGVHGFYLENLDKIPLIDEETLLMTMKHLREAADHYDNPVAHTDDIEGHYPRDRCLMVPDGLMLIVENEPEEDKEKIYKYIDLVDTEINPVGQNISSSLLDILNGKKIQSDHEYHPWPCWKLGVTSQWPTLHTAMLIQTMTYPGTVCLEAGAEIGETDVDKMNLVQWNRGSRAMHWMPYSNTRSLDESVKNLNAVLKVVRARRNSLAIRSNGVSSSAAAGEFDDGYRVPYHANQTLVLLRDYRRAENYLTVVNYGANEVTLDLSQVLVRAEVLLNSDEEGVQGGLTKWESLTLKPGQVILAKQSKWSI